MRLFAAALVALVLSGCTVQTDPVLRIAFVQPDDSLEPASDPQRLADAIADATGRPTEIYYVQSTQVALQALSSGHADAAFVDGSAGWFGWQRYGLDAVAAQTESDGRTHYVASAWIHAEATYETMADLEGADSCHTGLMKSAGTFMPLGWLIRNGLVERVGPDDVASIEPTLDAFFGKVRIPGSDADVYGGYPGALRCLSDGAGDVAFIKDTTPATYCGDAPRDWCLPLDDYRKLQDFAAVPSHPVMVGGIPADKRADLLAGLAALSDSTQGQAVIDAVLGGRGFVPVESAQAHLGEYGANLAHVPGMAEYVEGSLS